MGFCGVAGRLCFLGGRDCIFWVGCPAIRGDGLAFVPTDDFDVGKRHCRVLSIINRAIDDFDVGKRQCRVLLSSRAMAFRPASYDYFDVGKRHCRVRIGRVLDLLIN